MSEELTAIERYITAWKPNEKRIAELRADYEFALNAGAYFAAMAIWEVLRREALPPSHLPIRRLDITDATA